MNIIFALLIGWFELSFACFIRVLVLQSRCLVDSGKADNHLAGILSYMARNKLETIMTFGVLLITLPWIFPYIFTKNGEESYRKEVLGE